MINSTAMSGLICNKSGIAILKKNIERLPAFFLIFLVLITLFPSRGPCQASVATQRYDNARTGQNLSETILNTSNVNPATFGKLFTRAVDDEVWAQPLYVPSVAVPNLGTRNVLYVATVNNSVYAFDADDPGAAAPLWRVNLGALVPRAQPVNAVDVGQKCDFHGFSGNIGIVGTPVIDEATRTLYVIVRTRESSPVIYAATRKLYAVVDTMRSIAMEHDEFAHRLNAPIGIAYNATNLALRVGARLVESVGHAIESGSFVQRLHALDIATGAARPNSPVVIQASIQGNSHGSSNGIIAFDPKIQNQRGALSLVNGIVYITWAAHCDTGPYHGWIMGYDRRTLAQVLAKVVTPNGSGGGIWQSGAGPSADATGNLYLTVGNGTVTAPTGGEDYGNAFLKLSPSGEVLDWFIPYNFEALNRSDGDVGSAGVLLIPGTNLLTSGGKEGKLYVLNRNNLGHFQPASDSQIVQSLVVAPGGLYGTPTYWNGPGGPYVYTWGSLDRGKAFRLHGDLLMTKPVSETTMLAEGSPGGILSISAYGTLAWDWNFMGRAGTRRRISNSSPRYLARV